MNFKAILFSFCSRMLFRVFLFAYAHDNTKREKLAWDHFQTPVKSKHKIYYLPCFVFREIVSSRTSWMSLSIRGSLKGIYCDKYNPSMQSL